MQWTNAVPLRRRVVRCDAEEPRAQSIALPRLTPGKARARWWFSPRRAEAAWRSIRAGIPAQCCRSKAVMSGRRTQRRNGAQRRPVSTASDEVWRCPSSSLGADHAREASGSRRFALIADHVRRSVSSLARVYAAERTWWCEDGREKRSTFQRSVSARALGGCVSRGAPPVEAPPAVARCQARNHLYNPSRTKACVCSPFSGDKRRVGTKMAHSTPIPLARVQANKWGPQILALNQTRSGGN